jgi:hypothetical protein
MEDVIYAEEKKVPVIGYTQAESGLGIRIRKRTLYDTMYIGNGSIVEVAAYDCIVSVRFPYLTGNHLCLPGAYTEGLAQLLLDGAA